MIDKYPYALVIMHSSVTIDQSSLNKSNSQISVRAFFVAKTAQQFEFDWWNLIFNQSGGRFSN